DENAIVEGREFGVAEYTASGQCVKQRARSQGEYPCRQTIHARIEMPLNFVDIAAYDRRQHAVEFCLGGAGKLMGESRIEFLVVFGVAHAREASFFVKYGLVQHVLDGTSACTRGVHVGLHHTRAYCGRDFWCIALL